MNFFTKLLFLISVLLSFTPSVQGRNHVHDPSCVFHPHPSGLRAIDPKYTTRANLAHSEGVKGQTRTGKRLTAAIIDGGFHPEYTHSLVQKGVIHPVVSQKKLVRRLGEPSYSPSSDGAHGSGVMEALHLIASDALLLPLDTTTMGMSGYTPNDTTSTILSRGHLMTIQEAIRHRVDVINISSSLDNYDRKCLGALREAIRQGIVVIIAAGNDSHDFYKYRIKD